MTASEYIRALQELIVERGDLSMLDEDGADVGVPEYDAYGGDPCFVVCAKY